ncbi:MAG: helix-turn-helix transcriptional regulator [Euryhalocaulis sp.]|nr:helix-turn-helix transcriptional regulator [Euryhalocaulis sp.]MBA4801830.1 helix-turn-helix transcriptional regulator [Euryhalocaulis sp.]
MVKPSDSVAYQTLLSELGRLRKEAGLTQRELADRLGKPQSYVAKYELGERRLDVVDFLDIAEALSFDWVKLLSTVDIARS